MTYEEHLLDNRLQTLSDDVKGSAVAVWVNTACRLQRAETATLPHATVVGERRSMGVQGAAC
nr:hypothetical protein StreXyl84_63100 [Streptomyces sp. Xyl84]